MTNIFNSEWCDQVFEGKNKSYGAYDLRKKYSLNAIIALIATIILFLLLMFGPFIFSLINKALPKDEPKEMMTEVTLAEPPPIDKNEPPPPPPPPPPPLKSTIKFTPPEVVPDEEVPDDEPPPVQEELEDKDISDKTQEGDPDAGVDASLFDTGDGDKVTDAPPVEEDKVFTSVEQMPEFPGGEAAMFSFIQKNVKYPPQAMQNDIQGKVFVQFTIDKEGRVIDVKKIRGIGYGCDEEAVRVINNMPNWKAGKQNGKPAKVQYTIPVTFKISGG